MIELKLEPHALYPALDLTQERFRKMDHLGLVGYLEHRSLEVLVCAGGWPTLVRGASWVGEGSPKFLSLQELRTRYVDGVLSIAPDLKTAARLLDVNPSTLYRMNRRENPAAQ